MRKKLLTLAFSLVAAAFIGMPTAVAKAEEETQAAEITCNHQWQAVGQRATLTKDGSLYDECTECFITKNTKVVPRIKTVKLDRSSFTYNGKTKKPKLIIKDSEGNKISSSYYRVSYSKGRKNPGYYKVKVEFIKRYMGEKTLWFQINPKKASISKIQVGEKKLIVNIKNSSKQVSGYQIRYSSSKSFNGAKYMNTTKNKVTITGLSNATKYYVAVRAFNTVKKDGKKTKVYSKWSAKKLVTTKGMYEESNGPELCYEMLDLVNAERAKRGLEPYTWSTRMEKGTLIRAKELATSFDHYRPNGEIGGCAFRYDGSIEGYNEIIADDSQYEWLYGKRPEDILDAFLNSDGHRGTVIAKNYKYACIASSDTNIEEDDGTVFSYKKGDILPGYHDTFEMCCASYKGYWIITVSITSTELYWELDPNQK